MSVLKMVYHASFESHLTFGICHYYGTNVKLVKRVFSLQKRAIRTIFRLHSRTHCRPYFQKLNVMTFPAIYMYNVLVYVFKNMSVFTRMESGRTGTLLKGPRVYFESYRKSVDYRGILLFNKLPGELRDLTDINNFKYRLKEKLLVDAPYDF